MKYPAGISGPEYAAMEDGYEQGRAAGRAEMRVEVERVTRVFSEADTALNEKYDRVCEALDRVRALADEIRRRRLEMCRACRDPEFARVHSHGCGITRADVEQTLREALGVSDR